MEIEASYLQFWHLWWRGLTDYGSQRERPIAESECGEEANGEEREKNGQELSRIRPAISAGVRREGKKRKKGETPHSIVPAIVKEKPVFLRLPGRGSQARQFLCLLTEHSVATSQNLFCFFKVKRAITNLNIPSPTQPPPTDMIYTLISQLH